MTVPPARWEPAGRNIRYFIYAAEGDPCHDAVIEAPCMAYAAFAWFQGHAGDLCWVRHTNYDTRWPHTRAYADRIWSDRIVSTPPFSGAPADAV
jgi:hypothetical protein